MTMQRTIPMQRLTGRDALQYAQRMSLTLNTHTDPTAEARDGVTVAEAREIAREDPSLVWLDLPITHAPIPPGDGAAARMLRTLRDMVKTSERIAQGPGDLIVRERLRCACDLADMLGGESRESLIHVLQRVVASYTLDGTDSCPFSFSFTGRGLYGGLIFHQSDKQWSMHS